jgi:cytosine/adenosine deaminase-related metal-dependent hydrolase
MSMSTEWTATARWIFPADQPPLERGTITICDEGIAAVEPAGHRAADVDYGNAALLPGLVNAHTHLDLSGLRGRCPPGEDFTAWLRAVIRHRRGMTPDQVRHDTETGLAECLRFGTTLLGDISGQGQSWTTLASAPLRAIVFHELLGLTAERARQGWDDMQEWLPWRAETDECRVGLSPHAPYSVRRSLFEKAAAFARTSTSGAGRRIPVAIHLAESRAELELLAHHRGAFVDFLSELGVWDPDGLLASPEEVIDCFRDLPHVLWIHVNFLSPNTALGNGTIIYCPRTHAAFGHPPHPFRQFAATGARVALGTDSLASNPDLDVLAEARFVHQRHPDVSGADLLRMATLNGAEALGFASETGSLTPGKSADFVVLPLPNCEPSDPHELVFAADFPLREMAYRGQRRGFGS